MSAIQPEHQQLSSTMEHATEELRRIEHLLLMEGDFDARVLNDFRDAVNRVRTTAWGVQQYAESQTAEQDPHVVLSVLAGERVRVAFMMCEDILADLDNPKIRLQKGQLARLHDASAKLAQRLGEVIGS